MNAIRTAPGGAVVRGRHLRTVAMLATFLGTGCATSDSAILSLASTPVELSITVLPSETGEILPTPEMLELEMGESVTLAATALDVLGQPVGNAAILWSSSDPAVASVDGQGVLTTSQIGSTVVLATVNGVEATLEVVVSEASIP